MHIKTKTNGGGGGGVNALYWRQIAVKELLTEIGRVLPELDGVVPCYVQSDHMNQLGALRCSECNPNDYQNKG